MITDFLVQERVALSGHQFDTELNARIHDVLNKPRHLDSAPEKYNPLNLGDIDQEPFGTYSCYRRVYEAVFNNTAQNTGTLSLPKETVTCSYRVLCALKTLTLSGITKSTAKAHACRKLFGIILGCRVDGNLTDDMIWPAFKEHGDFYMNELSRAIVDSVYTEKERMIWELRCLMKSNYDDDALNVFGSVQTVEDLLEAIADTYKAACADQNFEVVRKDGKATNAVRYLRRQHV